MENMRSEHPRGHSQSERPLPEHALHCAKSHCVNAHCGLSHPHSAERDPPPRAGGPALHRRRRSPSHPQGMVGRGHSWTGRPSGSGPAARWRGEDAWHLNLCALWRSRSSSSSAASGRACARVTLRRNPIRSYHRTWRSPPGVAADRVEVIRTGRPTSRSPPAHSAKTP